MTLEERQDGYHSITVLAEKAKSRSPAPPRGLDRWSATLFLLGFGVLLVLAECLIARLRTTGDEPWYLLQTYALIHLHSSNLAPLVQDHALYAHFLGSAPDTRTADYLGNGERVIYYLPGYAAAIAPCYLLGGRPLVVAFQALAAALTGVLVFGEARRLFGSRWVALIAWLACLTPLPVLLYAGQIFPSTLATCMTFLGFVLATRSLAESQGLRLIVVGILIGLIAFWLPWLHLKYVLPALLLVGIALLVLLPQLRLRRAAGAGRDVWLAAVLIAGLALLSLILIGVYCQHTFGTWLPPNSKQQPHVQDPRFDLVAHLFGRMFLDPRSGLLPWVPLDLLVVPGLVLLLCRHPRQAGFIVAMLIAQLVTYLSAAVSPVFQGYALIARFTLECAPFFALCVGAIFAAARHHGRRAWSWPVWRTRPEAARLLVAAGGLALLGATVWFSTIGELAPWLLYPGSTSTLIHQYQNVLPGAWLALFPGF